MGALCADSGLRPALALAR